MSVSIHLWVFCQIQYHVCNILKFLIWHNNLSGVISDVICSLRSLLNLTVAYNFFSGFSQECSRLFNVGFDFSDNCIPYRNMQKPQSECFVIPSGNLNCLRIPTPKPLVCGTLAASTSKYTKIPSASP